MNHIVLIADIINYYFSYIGLVGYYPVYKSVNDIPIEVKGRKVAVIIYPPNECMNDQLSLSETFRVVIRGSSSYEVENAVKVMLSISSGRVGGYDSSPYYSLMEDQVMTLNCVDSYSYLLDYTTNALTEGSQILTLSEKGEDNKGRISIFRFVLNELIHLVDVTKIEFYFTPVSNGAITTIKSLVVGNTNRERINNLTKLEEVCEDTDMCEFMEGVSPTSVSKDVECEVVSNNSIEDFFFYQQNLNVIYLCKYSGSSQYEFYDHNSSNKPKLKLTWSLTDGSVFPYWIEVRYVDMFMENDKYYAEFDIEARWTI